MALEFVTNAEKFWGEYQLATHMEEVSMSIQLQNIEYYIIHIPGILRPRYICERQNKDSIVRLKMIYLNTVEFLML